MQILPKLNKVMSYVRSQLEKLPSDLVVETNYKPFNSIKNKVLRDKENEPAALSDLVRGRIFFSERFKSSEITELLNKIFGKQIKNIDNKLNLSKENGLEYYGILHVDLDIDGINFELQVMPIEYRPYKSLLHEIYEKFRDPKERAKLSDKSKKFLQNLHNKIYEELYDFSQSNRL